MAGTITKPITVIVGAGVTGLQTAISLLQTGHSITIVAEHLPDDPDSKSIEYTSPWAGGHWRSHATSSPGEEEVRSWDTRTYFVWRKMLEDATFGSRGLAKHKKGTGGMSTTEAEWKFGLGIRESVMYWSEETEETNADGTGLWWRDAVAGFRVLGQDERERATAEGGEKVVFGARYESVCINVPRYLKYLMEEVIALGAKVVKAKLDTEHGLAGVVADVKRLVSAENTGEHKLDAVVLATGLLSRKFLPKDEAERLYPVRGQTVLVKGEASKAITHIFPPGQITYIIPRPASTTTILGGSKDVGNWDEKEDSALTEMILQRAKSLIPELLNPDGKFEVLSVQVGRRPGRKGGPRVELEKGNVAGVRVVHAYGHSGAGYQNSVGSAEKVVRLLTTQ